MQWDWSTLKTKNWQMLVNITGWTMHQIRSHSLFIHNPNITVTTDYHKLRLIDLHFLTHGKACVIREPIVTTVRANSCISDKYYVLTKCDCWCALHHKIMFITLRSCYYWIDSLTHNLHQLHCFNVEQNKRHEWVYYQKSTSVSYIDLFNMLLIYLG